MKAQTEEASVAGNANESSPMYPETTTIDIRGISFSVDIPQ